MPVAKKTAPAKKTSAAKKSASAAPAKKTAEKTAAPKTHEELGERIAAQIEAGAFDASIIRLEDAITKRVNVYMREQSKKAAAAEKKESASAGEKTVPTPPKKTATKKITPVAGNTYKVSTRLTKLAGALVEFQRPKPDAEDKAVVVMKSKNIAGTPEGKRIVIPVSALEEAPESKKPVRKKK